MKEFQRILREAMPEIIGGLVVAAILAVIGAIYYGAGIWVTIAVALAGILLIIGMLAFLARLRKTMPSQRGEAEKSGTAPVTSDTLTLEEKADEQARKGNVIQVARGENIAQAAGDQTSASVTTDHAPPKRKQRKR